MNTANYIRNRLPKRTSREKRTPYEFILVCKPDLTHICVFGCTAYVYIPKANQEEIFLQNVKKGMMAGYCKETWDFIKLPRGSVETLTVRRRRSADSIVFWVLHSLFLAVFSKFSRRIQWMVAQGFSGVSLALHCGV